MAQHLNFCPNCGATLRFGEVAGEDRHRLSCPACGHIAYVNPRLVVTTLPITDAGEIVLLRRGIEPGRRARGRSRAASSRSTRPSTRRPSARPGRRPGCSSSRARSSGLYTRLEAAVVTIAFEARIVGGDGGADAGGARDPGLRAGAIPWSGIAFKTTTWALRDWIDRRRPDLTWPTAIHGH